MGGAVSAGEDNDELIDNLVEAEYIKTPMVERVFRAVDRAAYYADGCKENAYRDLAWKHGNLHLSAPCIYSEVMEHLSLEPGLSFLNLGSGTGYLSTMVGLILGPYGINHGVEIHSDVVEYATSKLEEFKVSLALDEYEFCPPSFVTGNCLLLDSTVHQYDRVYCGASCPEEHENYMKNLIRVGGILVMPLNDQLLQIIRTTETTWAVKSILPVSFASLILPSPKETLNCVKLPDASPLSLQEICRSTIRVLLRNIIDIENPLLKVKKRVHPRRKRPNRHFQRIVIPLFEETFDGPFGSDGDDDIYIDEPSVSEPLNSNVQAEGASQSENSELNSAGDVEMHELNPVENCMSKPPEGSMSKQLKDYMNKQLEECMSNPPEDISKNNCHCTKPESSKNGHSDADRSNGNLSDDSCFEECAFHIDTPSDRKSSSEKKTLSSRDRKRNVEEEFDEDLSDHATDSSSASRENSFLQKRAGAVIFKRVAFDDLDSAEDQNSPAEDEGSSNDVQEAPGAEGSYSFFMRQKISLLPLPLTLKIYLNNNREI